MTPSHRGSPLSCGPPATDMQLGRALPSGLEFFLPYPGENSYVKDKIIVQSPCALVSYSGELDSSEFLLPSYPVEA